MSGSAGVVPGQRVQVALDDGGGLILAHREYPHRTEDPASDVDCTAAGVHRLRSGDRPGRKAIDGIPRSPGVGPISSARRGRHPGRDLRPVRYGRERSGTRPPPGRLPGPYRPPDVTPDPRGCPPVPASFGGSRYEGRPGPRRLVAPARPRRAGRVHPTPALTARARELRQERGRGWDRSRRIRDQARRAWYARHRQRRFARFLGFGDRAHPAASPPAAGEARPAAASTTGPRRTANDQRNSMSDAAQMSACSTAPPGPMAPAGRQAPARRAEHPQPVGDEDRVHCSSQLRQPRRRTRSSPKCPYRHRPRSHDGPRPPRARVRRWTASVKSPSCRASRRRTCSAR